MTSDADLLTKGALLLTKRNAWLVKPPTKASRGAQKIRPGADLLDGCAPLIRVHGKVAALQGEQVVGAAICPVRCLALEGGWEICHGWHLHDQHSSLSILSHTQKMQNHSKAQLCHSKGVTHLRRSLDQLLSLSTTLRYGDKVAGRWYKAGGTWHPRHVQSPANGLCPAGGPAQLCHHTALVLLGLLACAYATGAALVLIS